MAKRREGEWGYGSVASGLFAVPHSPSRLFALSLSIGRMSMTTFCRRCFVLPAAPVVASLLFAVGCGAPGQQSTELGSSPSAPAAVAAAAATITPAEMRSRIAFLSSDEMRGRQTPSPGLENAAAYLASEHARFRLQPGGDSATYIQRYAFAPRRLDVGPPQDVFAPNVIAVLPGSDPELRDEYVVLSAHFDHVGVGRPINGDSIYNGADDNGSGTAALLEVAQALSGLPTAPRRSILFLHISGEEHGLLGSRAFSDNPTVPAESIVANINVDMIGRNSPDSVVVIGKDYSSLGVLVESVGERYPEIGLAVSDDLWPEERFFFRSDHFNFARLEIPSLFFFAGVHEDYHRPSDEVDRIDPDKAARVARLIFYSVQEIANAPGRPSWDPAGLAEVRSLTRGR